jgi:ribosomal protein S18 acetylase RimI-like enzyme
MIHSVDQRQEAPQNPEIEIGYGLVEKKDVNSITKIYLESFPQRVKRWFRKDIYAARFYKDVMDLMRLAYPRTFFAARHNRTLIGYLILRLPNTNLICALFRDFFFFRAAAHALTGRYGFAVAVLRRVFYELLSIRNSRQGDRLNESPHVYVLAVEENYRGMGIGTRLIMQAKSFCRESFQHIWLYVDPHEMEVIRLYERIGFRIICSYPTQHLMVLDLD